MNDTLQLAPKDSFSFPSQGWPWEVRKFRAPLLARPRSVIRVTRFERLESRGDRKRVVELLIRNADQELTSAMGLTDDDFSFSRPHDVRADGALAALDRISELQTDWDTYGSPPVPDGAVRQARAIVLLLRQVGVPDPTASPIPGGAGVQLEWNAGARGLEVDIGNDGTITFLRDDAGTMTEGKLGASPTRAVLELRKWIGWVKAV